MHSSQKTVNAEVNIVKIGLHSDIKKSKYNHFCTIIQLYSVMTASNVKKVLSKYLCHSVYAVWLFRHTCLQDWNILNLLSYVKSTWSQKPLYMFLYSLAYANRLNLTFLCQIATVLILMFRTVSILWLQQTQRGQ